MKKFSVTTETPTNAHAFVMLAQSMEDALNILKSLNLTCVSITEMPNYTGTIRDPRTF